MNKKHQIDSSSFQFVYDSRNIGKKTGILMKPKPQNQYDGFFDISLISGLEPDTENLFKIPDAPSKLHQKDEKPENCRYMDVQNPTWNQDCWNYFKDKRSAELLRQPSGKRFSSNMKAQENIQQKVQDKREEKENAWEYFKSKKKSDQKIQKYEPMQEQILPYNQIIDNPDINEVSHKATQFKEKVVQNIQNIKTSAKKIQAVRQKTPSANRFNKNKKQKRKKTISKSKSKEKPRDGINLKQINSRFNNEIKTPLDQIMQRKEKCHTTKFYQMAFNPEIQQELAQQKFDSQHRYPRRHRIPRLQCWKGEKASYFQGKFIGIIKRTQQRMNMDQQQ